MILSASRRTDIPCYYAEWFMRRIREGYALTRNPMNNAQLYRLPLTADIVDCIVFWTKDAQNIMPHLDELDERGYRYYFQFTLTPYGRDIERNLRPKSEIEDTFVKLSRRVGRERVVWRYDPILLNDEIGVDYHKAEFRRMCERLGEHTDTVTVSFVDVYAKLRTPLVREPSEGEVAELAGFVGETAKAFGLRAVACCESDLVRYGIERASCIDRERVERVCGCALDLGADKNQRNGCGCCESVDIGAYNTCANGCIYCYANNGFDAAKRRLAAHDPASPILVGSVRDGEEIRERKVKSHKIAQTSLF